jgi:beta-lactamase class A
MIKGLLFAAMATMRLAAISDNFDGKAGIAAIDLDTGQRIVFHENDSFPMASVCKVPVAIAFLQRVDRGEVSLDTQVTLGPDDFHAGASPIADEANGKPVKLALSRLFTHMVRDSDNSAVDYVLAHYVTPKEVNKAMRAIGVKNIDVDRAEGMIIGEILNEGDVIETRARWKKRMDSISQNELALGLHKFWRDQRDTATPVAVADLLAKLYRHEAGLKPESEEVLMKALRDTATGPDRIRAGIPSGAALAHKTGTMPGTLNDVGLITSPDGKHHIAIAVFTKWSRGTEVDRAKVVAAMTKAVYEELAK